MDDFLSFEFRYKNDKGENIELTFDEVQALDSPFFNKAMNLYHNYKMFGLPNANGWINERQIVLDVLSIIEDESVAYDSWEMNKHRS